MSTLLQDIESQITGVKTTSYLTGYFRQNETLLTKDEREAALIKGWDILAVEGGSDTIYHYRVPATLAQGAEKLAFKAVEFECSGATGRTWVNGQTGPMEADVTFNVVAIRNIDLSIVQKEAEERMNQAEKQSEDYKKQRTALTALEQKVRDRLQNGQQAQAQASK